MFGPGLIGWVLVIMIVVVIAVIFVVLMTRWRIDRAPTDPRGKDRSMAILKERYARGEINKAEFEASKRDLI